MSTSRFEKRLSQVKIFKSNSADVLESNINTFLLNDEYDQILYIKFDAIVGSDGKPMFYAFMSYFVSDHNDY